MTTKSLIVINGTLLALVVIGALVFLHPANSEPLRQSPPAATDKIKEGSTAGSGRSTPVSDMAPSERVLSEAQLERQNKVDAALQRQEGNAVAAQEPAPLPLVLLEPGPDLGLDAAQAAMFQDLRQAFADEMRDGGHSPLSPQYREHWLETQRAADDMLRMYLGDDAYGKFNVMAVQASARERAARK